ncbi:MAG: carbon monoxide dehydrogenase subunit G [Anaerolineae bacterium]|nr:carbon monoxide dehydrogenase subunit G [Anaerolineae bacterium]
MKIHGSYTFDAPQDEVWALLMDPQAIAKAIPGVENFHPIGENDYEAQLKLGLGAISGQYAGRVTISDVDAPTHYKMTVGGKGQRGFVNGHGEINLEPQDAKTVVHYTGDAALGGQLAGIGQRLVEGAARTLINQGFKSLEAQLVDRRAAVAPAPTPVPEIETPPAPEVAPEVTPEAAAPTPERAPEAPVPLAPPAPRPVAPAPPPAPQPALPITWVIIGAIIIIILLILLFRPV